LKLFINLFFQNLLKTAAKLSGRFSEMHVALGTQHVSLNNACTRAVCKWFSRNKNNGNL